MLRFFLKNKNDDSIKLQNLKDNDFAQKIIDILTQYESSTKIKTSFSNREKASDYREKISHQERRELITSLLNTILDINTTRPIQDDDLLLQLAERLCAEMNITVKPVIEVTSWTVSNAKGIARGGSIECEKKINLDLYRKTLRENYDYIAQQALVLKK